MWGESIIKASGKIFVSFRWVEGTLCVSVKLPRSSKMALTLPFTAPRGRWVIAHFTARQNPEVKLLRGLIEESFRAVAPKEAGLLNLIAMTERRS